MLNLKIPSGNELLNPQKILNDELKLNYGAKVGDLGCGTMGYFCLQAARLVGDAGRVYAVDLLKDHLKSIVSKAKESGLNNITPIWSDLEKYGATKINDRSLDFCLLINILFQNKHHEKIIKEASRLLKLGGKLLIIDWRSGRFPLGPSQQYKIEPEKIISLIPILGLRCVKEFTAGPYHFGIILEKVI